MDSQPQTRSAIQQPQPVHLHTLQTTQPPASQPMSMSLRRPDDTAGGNADLGLRGGDRGGLCPGRFCFCIPCPIPCDCCIIPL